MTAGRAARAMQTPCALGNKHLLISFMLHFLQLTILKCLFIYSTQEEVNVQLKCKKMQFIVS